MQNHNSDRLKLKFNQFHATDHATVISRGRYWLNSDENKANLVTEFTISEKQTVDGYLDTVEKLKLTINKLADEILMTLDNLQGAIN